MADQKPTLDYGRPNKRKGVPLAGVILLIVLAALVVLLSANAFLTR